MKRTTQPTRILVIGSGAREHALAWRMSQDPGVNDVYVAPGREGMRSGRIHTIELDPLDPDAVVAGARQVTAELVVIGPESALAVGVADQLRTQGFEVFGPGREGAQIETSKTFCSQVAHAARVRMADGGSYTNIDAACDFVRTLARDGRGAVVKEDGLAAGKGVQVFADALDAIPALRDLLAGSAGVNGTKPRPVIVEERLDGIEASVIGITDGIDIIALPAARDYKRLLDGDHGPNTGGMGAYSPLPDLPDDVVTRIVDQVHRPLLAELRRRGIDYRGALYAGLMLTSKGPRLLECNARFGDPETQAIMPRIQGSLGPWLMAAARGRLRDAIEDVADRPAIIPSLPQATVAISVVAQGYPSDPRKGDVISGLKGLPDGGLFHAGTRLRSDGEFRTDGGRIVTVVASAPSMGSARREAMRRAEKVQFAGAFFRRDIAADLPSGQYHPEPQLLHRAGSRIRRLPWDSFS